IGVATIPADGAGWQSHNIARRVKQGVHLSRRQPVPRNQDRAKAHKARSAPLERSEGSIFAWSRQESRPCERSCCCTARGNRHGGEFQNREESPEAVAPLLRTSPKRTRIP